MESLQGHFLIATPQMPDPRFRKSLIYICSHSHEGAMGMVVNRPSSHSLASLFVSADIPLPLQALPCIYIGGPVEEEVAFFLYSAEYHTAHFLQITETVRLSRDPEILYEIAKGCGPRHYLFLLGYAGWAPGQLEEELRHDGWLSFPAEDEVLFRTPDEQKWQKAAESFGVDISLYSDVAGRA